MLSSPISAMNSPSDHQISRLCRSSPAIASTMSFMPYCTPTEQADASTINSVSVAKSPRRRRM